MRYFCAMEKVAGLNWAIAAVVKEIREARGLTQGQLAGFSGLSEVYLSKLERGLRGDSVNALLLIANTLEISLAELMQCVEAEMARGATKPIPLHGRPRQKNKSPATSKPG